MNNSMQPSPQQSTSKLVELTTLVTTTVHMVRCQLTVARAAIVSNDQKGIVAALNEMESLIRDLEKRLQ